MSNPYIRASFENNRMDKISYALGLNVGANLLQSGIENVVVDDFAAGIRALVEGTTPEMSQEEAGKLLQAFFSELEAKKHEGAIEEGATFLAENAQREEVTVLPSGLQYEVLAEGSGATPAATDNVKCHYHGTLINGTVFDSSVQRGEPAVFPVNGVIQGWVEALQLMAVGSKWKLYVPSDLAYGAQGAGQAIGPHTTLIFEVELIAIQ